MFTITPLKFGSHLVKIAPAKDDGPYKYKHFLGKKVYSDEFGAFII